MLQKLKSKWKQQNNKTKQKNLCLCISPLVSCSQSVVAFLTAIAIFGREGQHFLHEYDIANENRRVRGFVGNHSQKIL